MTDVRGARPLWRRLETIHAVTYFAPECRDASVDAGLQGFWMGYFACRAAPMGAVTPGTVEAAFYNFSPSMVARSVPDAWAYAAPMQVVEWRAGAAARALRRVVGHRTDLDAVAEQVAATLDVLAAAGSTAGRPLYAANARLPLPDDPVARLWQHCTTLREHRGDGHVACLRHAGLDGVEAHLLQIGAGRGDADAIETSRGWSDEDWSVGRQRMMAAGLVEPGGGLSKAGRLLHGEIEGDTDRLACETLDAVEPDDIVRLMAMLDPLCADINDSGMVPYPNPMGLPPVDDDG